MNEAPHFTHTSHATCRPVASSFASWGGKVVLGLRGVRSARLGTRNLPQDLQCLLYLRPVLQKDLEDSSLLFRPQLAATVDEVLEAEVADVRFVRQVNDRLADRANYLC